MIFIQENIKIIYHLIETYHLFFNAFLFERKDAETDFSTTSSLSKCLQTSLPTPGTYS